MAEFDDKLNQLLSDPGAMAQIMKMAQSLMGGSSPGEAPSPPPAAEPAASDPARMPPQELPFHFPGGGQSGDGGIAAPGGAGNADAGLFSGLGGVDPQTVARLLPILREFSVSQDTNARRLLFALRPYLKPERQDKVERALQLARLFRVGKKFLLKGDFHV